MELEILGASKSFEKSLFEDFNLTINGGEIVALLGPSGCGKTTLLRCICGLDEFDTGEIILDGKNLVNIPTHLRDIGYIFQSPVLFPHLDVGRNLRLGQDIKDEQEISKTLAEVGLEGFENRNVESLSGGEGQRVALARALLAKPKALLLDEPFSALDDELRFRLIDEVGSIIRQKGLPVIHVTHDEKEAITISDRIIRL